MHRTEGGSQKQTGSLGTPPAHRGEGSSGYLMTFATSQKAGIGFQNIGMHFSRTGSLPSAIERVAMGVYNSLISTVAYPQLCLAPVFVMWYYL